MTTIWRTRARVYPRASGGTTTDIAGTYWSDGLSPRERGNPLVHFPAARNGGSIPARAGEPPSTAGAPKTRRVYPRASGGTSAVRTRPCPYPGLSPRERGNRGHDAAQRPRARSIPARAGEPRPSSTTQSTRTVYPRASGGTQRAVLQIIRAEGLSPRERGNRHRRGLHEGIQRSIPARAGEPAIKGWESIDRWVYPRASGGTALVKASLSPRCGLSPRERGNRSRQRRSLRAGRSIPARAGEPAAQHVLAGVDQVYPRASGGTGLYQSSPRWSFGLSPRERGNRLVFVRGHRPLRSIPARAGEPRSTRTWRSSPPVYPRASGGTRP